MSVRYSFVKLSAMLATAVEMEFVFARTYVHVLQNLLAMTVVGACLYTGDLSVDLVQTASMAHAIYKQVNFTFKLMLALTVELLVPIFKQNEIFKINCTT